MVRYICRETFVSKTSILFELYGHMYCYYNVLPEALQKFFFRGTYLQWISVFIQNFKFGGVTVLAVQLFNKIKRKKKKTKNMKKQVSLYFRGVMSKDNYFL